MCGNPSSRRPPPPAVPIPMAASPPPTKVVAGAEDGNSSSAIPKIQPTEAKVGEEKAAAMEATSWFGRFGQLYLALSSSAPRRSRQKPRGGRPPVQRRELLRRQSQDPPAARRKCLCEDILARPLWPVLLPRPPCTAHPHLTVKQKHLRETEDICAAAQLLYETEKTNSMERLEIICCMFIKR
ncbi:uncharacterized protein LOC125509530 isoform X2 [Triticum urartu]|nr:uncharacterized protein LOC125509530 isoform X2 [Triticum urartu]